MPCSGFVDLPYDSYESLSAATVICGFEFFPLWTALNAIPSGNQYQRRPLFSFDCSAISEDLFNWVIVLAFLRLKLLELTGYVQFLPSNTMHVVLCLDGDGESGISKFYAHLS